MVSLVKCFNLSSCVFECECAFSALAPGVVCVIQSIQAHPTGGIWSGDQWGACGSRHIHIHTHLLARAHTHRHTYTYNNYNPDWFIKPNVWYFLFWCLHACTLCVSLPVNTYACLCTQTIRTVSPLPGFVGMFVCIHSYAARVSPPVCVCVCVCFCTFVSVCAPPWNSSPLPQPVCAVQPSNASYLSD